MRITHAFLSLFALILASPSGFSQTTSLSCIATAVPVTLRAEGLADLAGDIELRCSGGTPNTTVQASIAVDLSAPVTNRVVDDSFPRRVDAQIFVVDGPVVTALVPTALLEASNRIAFPVVPLAVSAQGTVSLRIAGVRVASAVVSGGLVPQVLAILSSPTNVIAFQNPQQIIGTVVRGLYATNLPAVLPCRRLPALPAEQTLGGFLTAGIPSFSFRFTEGFTDAFQPRRPTRESNGTRIVVRYGGLPATSRLFAPDVLVGTNGAQQTSAGEFGVPVGAGAPGAADTLVLVRVAGTDAQGAGGTLATTTPTASLGVLGEIPVSAGSATAVYEVVSANRNALEGAQVPTFFTVATVPEDVNVVRPTVALSFGPLSSLTVASATAPVPRFTGNTPPTNDCFIYGDCGANYFPQLFVEVARPLEFTLEVGGSSRDGVVLVRNAGGGALFTQLSVTYQQGNNWLRVEPGWLDEAFGFGNTTIRVFANAAGLAPGTYRASIRIDSGSAGTRDLPVTLTVQPATTPPPTTPTTPPTTPPPTTPTTPVETRAVVERVFNAANFVAGPVAPGSIVIVQGARFAGQAVTITFNGLPGEIQVASGQELRVILPADLTGTSAETIVTVDGVAGVPFQTAIAPAAPAIFHDGVVNLDGSVNASDNPAVAGQILTLYTTGARIGDGATITVQLGNRFIAVPTYAGPAPGLPGMELINLVIPADLPSQVYEATVCVNTRADFANPSCSAPARVGIRAR